MFHTHCHFWWDIRNNNINKTPTETLVQAVHGLKTPTFKTTTMSQIEIVLDDIYYDLEHQLKIILHREKDDFINHQKEVIFQFQYLKQEYIDTSKKLYLKFMYDKNEQLSMDILIQSTTFNEQEVIKEICCLEEELLMLTPQNLQTHATRFIITEKINSQRATNLLYGNDFVSTFNVSNRPNYDIISTPGHHFHATITHFVQKHTKYKYFFIQKHIKYKKCQHWLTYEINQNKK